MLSVHLSHLLKTKEWWHDDMMTWWPDDLMTWWHNDRELRRQLAVWYISILRTYSICSSPYETPYSSYPSSPYHHHVSQTYHQHNHYYQNNVYYGRQWWWSCSQVGTEKWFIICMYIKYKGSHQSRKMKKYRHPFFYFNSYSIRNNILSFKEYK